MTDGDGLRIAFIGGRGVGGTYSGIETYYEEVGARLAARGHEVTAYCRAHFTPDVATWRGIHVRRLPAVRSKHLETISHSALSTLDALRRPFDVVQYHAIGSAPLALVPRLQGRVSILSCRGLDWQRPKWGRVARGVLRFGEWASARCPTATVVVSHTLEAHYARVHGIRAVCIPNAVPPATPRPPDRIRQLGLEPDGYVLFAGRLSPEKGVHVLLEAMRPLAGRLALVVAGGSSHTGGYVERLRAMAWPDVHFLGSVDHATVEELYTSCRAYVLPSTMEGLSVGLLEALAFGTCIVTTDIPENREVVGSAALTFAPGDVGALRAHLERIADDPAVAAEYRARAAAHAAAQPGWDEIALRTEALYLALLAGRELAEPAVRRAA